MIDLLLKQIDEIVELLVVDLSLLRFHHFESFTESRVVLFSAFFNAVLRGV